MAQRGPLAPRSTTKFFESLLTLPSKPRCRRACQKAGRPVWCQASKTVSKQASKIAEQQEGMLAGE